MSKFLTFAATGLAGLVLGAGIGVAAAGQDSSPQTPERSGITSMDEMHAAMVDQMPAELAEQCTETHAAMGEHMGDADHTSMMGSMGSMMGSMGSMTSGMGSDMSGYHSEHHPEAEG